MVMIEVAGEASPLSYQNVINTLVMAASSNQQQVKVGTQQLQNWQKQAAYHSLLQVCFVDTWRNLHKPGGTNLFAL